jgi:hypothetical protein
MMGRGTGDPGCCVRAADSCWLHVSYLQRHRGRVVCVLCVLKVGGGWRVEGDWAMGEVGH